MKKRFALAVIVTTAIALGLVGCGVEKMGTVPKLRS